MPVPTCPETSSLEFLKIGIQALGYIVGWGLVVWGWNVSHQHNRSRDERKDLRDKVNEIADIVRNVESDVVAFLTDSEGVGKTAGFWTVQFGAQRVNSTVVAAPIFKTGSIEAALISYRKAITGQALGGPTSVPKSSGDRDRDLRLVSKCGNALIRELEVFFAQSYPSKKKFK